MQPIQQWFIELISIISDILVGAAAIAAIIGLWQWRIELVGKTKFELARKIIQLAFEFEDELKSVRSAFTSPNESSERIKLENENPSETIILDELFARTRRLQSMKETLHKLHEAAWEAEIILSPEAAKLVQPLEGIFHELGISIRHFYDESLIQLRTPHPGIDQKKMEEYQDVIKRSENSPFSSKVDKTIDDLMDALKKYVR